MEHDLDALERPLNVARIDEVALDKLNTLNPWRQILTVAGAQIIQHTDLVTALDERANDMGANESRAARDQVSCHR